MSIKSSWVLFLVLSLLVSQMATATTEDIDTDELSHHHGHHHKKAKSPAHAPAKAPVHAPVKAPVRAPAKAPVHAPVKAPVHAPAKAPVRSPPSKASPPAKAPVYYPPKTPSVPISGPPGCAGKCMRYCKGSSLPKRRCMRACGACCNKLNCVPGLVKCDHWTSVIENGRQFKCP